MKFLVQFIFLVILVSSCATKEVKTFSIQGVIAPIKVDYLILQQETDIERKISTIIDTIRVDDNGKFEASYNEIPYLYTLILPNKKKIDLAIGKDQNLVVDIQNDGENVTSTIMGSDDTSELLKYEQFRTNSLNRLVVSVRDEIKALKKADIVDTEKIEQLGQLELSNYDKHLNELNDYIKNNMSHTIALYATSIRWKGAQNLALFDSLSSDFETQYPNLEISKKIREKLTRLQQTEIGGKVTNINMLNANGDLINLSSIKSDFILIDFWASWCGPCRRESPALNKLMTKYPRDLFDIYGVSLDDKRDKWLAAIEKDNRFWTNVSSLERFKTPAAYDYTVTALPDNYLINKEGIILAKNIHGEELVALINNIISDKILSSLL